jgi:predicted ATPase
MSSSSLLLRSVELNKTAPWPPDYPFSVPVIRSFPGIDFESPVTFFVGENGCGKSTLLEAVACAAHATVVGSEGLETDKSLAQTRLLAKKLKLIWSQKTHRGFFMRSEDFFGYARKMANTSDDLEQDLEQVERDYADKSVTARVYARSAYLGQLGAIRRAYGEGLDARSHGEAYLALFESRFVPKGLYLLDEPEAPLSPRRQLSFLAMLRSMVAKDAQFIIATHSPIITAFPGAVILKFEDGRIEKIGFEEFDHVQVLKLFLENTDAYIKGLFDLWDEISGK